MSGGRGSETRRRRRQVGVRLTDEEFAAITVAAATRGVSVPEMLRNLAVTTIRADGRRGHHCPHLAELDCYAALGDTASARLARWHTDHPDGPQSAEEYAEEHAVRVGFERRRMN